MAHRPAVTIQKGQRLVVQGSKLYERKLNFQVVIGLFRPNYVWIVLWVCL